MVKENRVLFGVATIGNWKFYNPVFYRIYYEDSGGATSRRAQRKSLLVLSRLGFLAVAAALSYKHNINEGSLAIIAPLTLATIGVNEINDVVRRLEDWPDSFSEHIVDGILEAASLDTIIKINEDGTLLVNKNENNKEKIHINRNDVIIVNKMKCDDNQCRAPNNDQGYKGFPIICSYNCTLCYTVISNKSNNNDQQNTSLENRELHIVLNIIPVPITMTTKIRDSIIIFREQNVEIDMESMLKALILHGVYKTIITLFDEGKYEDNSLDLTIFYDTTHGINKLLPPLSYVIEILDPMIVLKVAGMSLKLIEKLQKTASINNPVKYVVRSYLYNSDPVTLGKMDITEYIKITLDNNISYNYRILTRESAILVGYGVSQENNNLRRSMQGMIRHMARIRGIIDEFISYRDTINPQQCVNNSDNIECRIMMYILAMYIAKLGMFHWFTQFLSLSESNNHIEESIFPLIEFRINTERANITFKRVGGHLARIPPHIAVLSNILWDLISKYIGRLYNALIYARKIENNGSKSCFDINILKLLLDSLDVKISSLINSNMAGGDTGGKVYSDILTISEFYTAMVEPSARVLVRQELDRLSSDVRKVIDYLLPRGFKVEFDTNNCIHEDTGEVFGEKALCFYPATRVEPNEKHVRNFIAHGGFTKLNRDWCLALKEQCKAFAVCVERPLDLGVLLRIAFP
ncbi:MAG: hypothetical protein GSR84_00105 [Desulfurococcales archaeon]|nr:hypothetical protein [Desulfurococcales archaeon]